MIVGGCVLQQAKMRLFIMEPCVIEFGQGRRLHFHHTVSNVVVGEACILADILQCIAEGAVVRVRIKIIRIGQMCGKPFCTAFASDNIFDVTKMVLQIAVWQRMNLIVCDPLCIQSSQEFVGACFGEQ